MTRNEIFACAIDYLYKKGLIVEQSELASKMGTTESTISRILNNKVRKPSDESLRKLNAAFGNIFNPRWLRGESDIMLAEQLSQEEKKESDPNNLLSGIENLLEISARQIKENEDLRRRLQSSIDELNGILSQFKCIRSPKPYYESKQNFLSANEPINEK